MHSEITEFGVLDLILCGVIVCLLGYLLCTADIGPGLAWAVQKAAPSVVTRLEVDSLTLFPLRISGLRASVTLQRINIYIGMSWSRCALYRRGDDALGEDSDKPVNVQIDDFVLSVSGVSFQDICGVSQKKLDEAKKKIIHTAKTIENGYLTCLVMSLCRLHCSNVDFTFQMADPEGLVVNLKAIELSCYCEWAGDDSRVVDCHMQACCGDVVVHSRQALVVKLWAERLDLMVQLLSRKLHMIVKATFPGKLFIEAGIQDFLVLFGQYQDAEDDAIEVKELHGMSPAGKMKLMSVRMADGTMVCLRDSRLAVPLVMRLVGVHVALASDKQLFDDTKIVKTITAAVDSISFIGLHSTVLGVRAEIVKTVNNIGEFVDSEVMDVSVADVHIAFVQPLFLAWLCALQDTSNKIPSSRFAHSKSSVMSAHLRCLFLSIQSSALVDSPVAGDVGSGGWTESCIEQPDPVHRFSIDNMAVHKTQSVGSVLSSFDMTIGDMSIENSFLTIRLMDKYDINLDMAVPGYTKTCAVNFNFRNALVRFDLAQQLEIKQFFSEVFTLSHCAVAIPTGDTSSVMAECVSDPSIFMVCMGLNTVCPRPEQYDVEVDNLTCTAGVLTYLRFSYGLAELRSFVSKSVDTLAGIKAGERVAFLYNPRRLHTYSDVDDPKIWSPHLPDSAVLLIPAKPPDSYLKVSVRTLRMDGIVSTPRLLTAAEKTRCAPYVNMRIHLDDFSFQSIGESSTIISWSIFRVFSDKCTTKAFVVFGGTRTTMVDSVTDISSTTVESEYLTLSLSASMQLGHLLEAALHQRDLFRRAVAPPSVSRPEERANGRTQTASPIVADAARSQARKKSMSIRFKQALCIEFDCTFENQKIPKFCTVEWTQQLITIISTDDALYNEGRVRDLDGNTVHRSLGYTGFSGGDIYMSCSKFCVRVAPETADYILSTSVVYSGVLYLASVVDHRVEVLSHTVVLSDDIAHSSPLCYCQLESSAAPSKVYTSLEQTYSSFGINLHARMPQYLDAINKVLSVSLPPNNDPSTPLFWWDNYRYWVQGSLLINFEDLAIVYTVVGATRAVLNLHILTGNTTLSVTKKLVELRSGEFSINAEIIENISKTRKRNKRQLRRSSVMRSQLFSIPRFSLSLLHNRKAVTTVSGTTKMPIARQREMYTHHDVYLNPSRGTPWDKFAHFRTRKWTIDWALHVHCARNSHKRGIVSLYARLDVLLRVVDILQRQSSPAPAEERGAVEESLKNGTADADKDVAWLFDVINSTNIFLSFDKFLACSWPSDRNLEGVVCTYDSLVLQMKQFREFDEHVFRRNTGHLPTQPTRGPGETATDTPTNSLQIETLKIDIDKLEVFVRDWTLPVSSHNRRTRPLLRSRKSELSEQFEVIPSLNGLFGSIYKLFVANKVSMSLMTDHDIETLGVNEKGHHRRTSITPHVLLARPSRGIRVLPGWMHPWDEYWWGVKEIKQTHRAPSFFSSLKKHISSNTYVRYRYLMAELQVYGKGNERVKSRAVHRPMDAQRKPRKKANASTDSLVNSPETARPRQRSRFTIDRCLSISDFASNHALSHPPPSVLPTSYFYTSLPVHAVDLVRPHVRTEHHLKSSTAPTHLEKPMRSNQIWGLTIADLRLLWTLGLRNALFGYIAHYYEILEYQNSVHQSNTIDIEVDERKKGPARSEVESVDKTDHVDASVAAEILASPSVVLRSDTHEEPAVDICASPFGDVLEAAAVEPESGAKQKSVLSKIFLSPGGKCDPTEIDLKLRQRRGKLKRSDAKGLNLRSSGAVTGDRNNCVVAADAEAGIFVPSALSSPTRPSGPSSRKSLLLRDSHHPSLALPQHLSGDRTDVTIAGRLSAGYISTLSAAATVRDSPLPISDFVSKIKDSPPSVDDGPSSLQHQPNNTLSEIFLTPSSSSAHSPRKPRSPVPSAVSTRGPASLLSVGRNRASSIEKLFNREALDTNSYDFFVDEPEPGLRIRPAAGSPHATSSSHPTPCGHSLGSIQSDIADGDARLLTSPDVPSQRRYLIVQLIDPQVNFLDEKTQSSLLIVTGKSSLEGQKGTCAFTSRQGDGTELKRENTLKLHMDAVSAYTVSSALQREDYADDDPFFDGDSDVVDVVHWKATDCTDQSLDDCTAGRQTTGPVSGERVVNSATGCNDQSGPKISETRVEKYDLEGVAINSRGKEKSVNRLQLAIADFEIKALYTFHEAVDVEEEKLVVLSSDKELVSLFVLDIPEVCLDVNSLQFYIILNVVTNLLLAPPPKTETSWQKEESEEPKDVKRNVQVLSVAESRLAMTEDGGGSQNPRGIVSSLTSAEFFPSPVVPVLLDINDRKDRDDVQRVLESMSAAAPGSDAASERGLSRHVEYFLGRGVWILRTDDGKKSRRGRTAPENVPDASSEVEIGFMGLFGAHTFRNDGGSTSLFEVQRFWVGKDLQKQEHASKAPDEEPPASKDAVSSIVPPGGIDAGEIVAPRLHFSDPCTRCGREFEVRRNTSTSCRVHLDSEGNLGAYKRYLVDSGSRCRYISKWNCCGQFDEQAAGCSLQAHVCKEVMLSVRAEANPAVIIDNLEVTVYNALEISVFPGAQYELCVKITRQLVDILHTYFSIKTGGNDLSGNDIDSEDSKSEGVVHTESKNKYQRSAIYIKYLRVGDINVEVSTNGFPVNLKGYNAIVAPLIRHGRVADWPSLIWMFEKHAIWSVTKHTATSGITQMWKSVFSAAHPRRPETTQMITSNEEENNFWGDDNDEGARRGSDFLGIMPNKGAFA